MQIWTVIALNIILMSGLLACSTSDPKKGASADEVDTEVSFKKDSEEIAKLRAEIPEDIKKSNDRLSEMLNRWKEIKTPPNELRSKFDDELRKMRVEAEKKWKRLREDFNHSVNERRKDFQEKQKDERDDFFDSKPKGDKRSQFTQKQSRTRDRFNADLRDERDKFEDSIKEARKNFDAEMANRRSEFKLEFPEYTKLYNEKQKEKVNSVSKSVAPALPTKPEAHDVNKGGDGWPESDPSELRKLPPPPPGN